MRRRLYLTYLPLLAAAVLAMAYPLATDVAARYSQAMYIDRADDTARFASLAETALRTGRTAALRAELEQYDAVFGVGVAIVDRDRTLTIGSRPDLDLRPEPVRDRIEEALTGESIHLNRTIWPWQREPMVVANPVTNDGEVIGAAVTISPTWRLRAGIVDTWGRLLAGTLLAVLVGVVVVALVARWVLRPVAELDLAAHALSRGRFEERVASGTGPPELRRLAESFNAMVSQIAVLLERQRSFVSHASHQMRTPLAALRLWLENLEPSVGPDGRHDHAMALEEVGRMARLYDSLLAFASAEASAVRAVDVDVAAAARDRVDGWRELAARRGVRITGPEPGELHARAAPDTLDQALDVIIDNAVKFSGRGSTVTVAVEAVPPDRVAVSVTDTGPGMTPQEARDALQPFWRRPADQNVEGSGLGLTIANALVSASGGRLDLSAAEPHGLRVRIELPAASAHVTSAVRETPGASGTPGVPAGPGTELPVPGHADAEGER